MPKIDKNLLAIISENSRMKLNDIAYLLKKSPQRLKYSINLFKKENIVSCPYLVFDYSFFGLLLFRVYFKGGYIGEKDKDEIITKLTNNPYVNSIYELTGEFDLAVEISAPNPSKFNKELKKISTLIPTMNNYKIILNIVTLLYPRLYLIDNSIEHLFSREIIVGGDRGIQEFNSEQKKVISILLNNPLKNLALLSSEAGMNIRTSNSILKDLQDKKFIRGFRYVIDTSKVGVEKSKLFLKLHNMSAERDAELLTFLREAKEIVQVNRTIGDWNMEIDIESFDKKRIRYIILRLREEFKDIIETFNLIDFYKTHKVSYLPLFLFQQES
ncbi:MAG: hypothetical protein ABIJ08_04630 [Nanoarchaeota archaeon]